MHQANNPEELQVFFEIAMSVGSSHNLEEMTKNALLNYLRKLNCSYGAILKLISKKSEYSLEKIISIPFKSKGNSISTEFGKLIPDFFTKEELEEYKSRLPIQHSRTAESHFYIMNLEDYGFLLLKKNNLPLNDNTLFTLRSVNQKLSQACIACEQNQGLLAAKEKAEESDKLKTAFIENISHEIRTPLNAVIGYSTLIADNHISGSMLQQACSSIITGSNNLLYLVEGLLDISLLESGNLKLKYTLCNINQMLLDLETVFTKHLEREQKQTINLKIVTPLSDLFVVTDIVRLHQVFDKLISNAIRFSDQGEIEIGYERFERNRKDDLPINLIFYIKDNGIGIAKENQEEIFKPFNRILDSNEKLYNGTGIGLTIVKHLTHLLEGDVWVESEPGKGSKFYFSLPTIRSVDELVSSM